MDRQYKIQVLKSILRRDVASLLHRPDIRWRTTISRMAVDFKSASLPAVLFGGTLRSLLMARLFNKPFLRRPRDLDIVVDGNSVDSLKEKVQEYLIRQTRFGGLKLERGRFEFDVWPLSRTWAIEQDKTIASSFHSLPLTTFLNLEAIAVDLWVKPGKARLIYSGDDQFFEGLLDTTIEVNREENPFPALCIVRSLSLAYSTGFRIGPRLAKYLSVHRETVSDQELEFTQKKHYGSERIAIPELRKWLDILADRHRLHPHDSVTLPIQKQRDLFERIEEQSTPKMNFHFTQNGLEKG